MKKITDEKFKTLVNSATSWFDLLEKCGYKCREKKNTMNETTKTYHMTAKAHVKKRIVALELTVEHFNTARRCKKWRSVHQLTNKRRTPKQLKKILNEANRCYICEWCRCEGMELWNGEWLWRDWPIKLQIDHIDGKHSTDEDDRVENLRYLCPNCHSQTPTFGSKNIKRISVS